MGRLDMLAACLQAVVHGRGQAGLVAAQTGLDAAGHFFVHGRTHSSGKKGFWIKSRGSRVGLRFASINEPADGDIVPTQETRALRGAVQSSFDISPGFTGRSRLPPSP